MSKNSNLHNAKVAKNDDFFTQLSDIENELGHYWSHGVNHFEGKSVLMNCDNPKFSNFWVYFHKNFSKLKLKRIGAIHYSISEPAYYKEYTGGDDFDITVGKETLLRGNGDFRSEECIEILKGYDMVVTNPPFSLWREYIMQLVEYNREFIIIGNKNAITYKEVFPLLRDNKAWLGANMVSIKYFGTPSGELTDKINGLSRWFTNVDLDRRHEYLVLSKEYTPEAYPKYDNYDAINVDKVSDIPIDYFECFIVPDSYLPNLDDTFTVYEDAYEMFEALKNDEISTEHYLLHKNNQLYIPVDNEVQYIRYLLINAGIDDNDIVMRNGQIGVPLTFLGKLCSEQFEIVGADYELASPMDLGNGKRGTGRFYVKRERELAVILTHSNQANYTQNVLNTYGIFDMKYRNGVMGVPITYLGRHNPEQFEIVGGTANGQVPDEYKIGNYKTYNNPYLGTDKKYQRILIKSNINIDYENKEV